MISGHLDYSDPVIQSDLENLMRQLESTTFIDPVYSESWLRDLLDYVDRNKDYDDTLDISSEDKFVDVLNRVRIFLVSMDLQTLFNVTQVKLGKDSQLYSVTGKQWPLA